MSYLIIKEGELKTLKEKLVERDSKVTSLKETVTKNGQAIT